jgi:lysophospholipase L1-like esterase
MTGFFRYIIAACFLLFSFELSAQTIAVGDGELARKYPFVGTVFNRIFNATGLDPFFQKLSDLKKSDSGTVSVVHIGDSHIQADFLSGEVRASLQQNFGNAGRGLVFPYKLAQSNSPDDIISSSTTRWQFNRVAHPEIKTDYGISGYGLISMAETASINLALRLNKDGIQSFSRLKFFLDSSAASSWLLQAENNNAPYLIKKETDSLPFREVSLDTPASGFTLTSLPSSIKKEFYGVSLENDSSGIIYHTIGVNGARYDQYNIADLFWQQLPALKADLYIISLGTNEAQRAAFNQGIFYQELRLFLEKIRQASPGAAIVLTTAPDSYKGRASNRVLQQLNQSLTNYCNDNHIPLWDLYRITNGYGSAYSWSRRGLMSRDRIHFTAEGYRLQGELLFSALIKAYNSYISVYQADSGK